MSGVRVVSFLSPESSASLPRPAVPVSLVSSSPAASTRRRQGQGGQRGGWVRVALVPRHRDCDGSRMSRRASLRMAVDGLPLCRGLSDELRQLLVGCLRGDSEADMAAALAISRSALGRRLEALFHEVDVSSRDELVARAVEQQLRRCLGAS